MPDRASGRAEPLAPIIVIGMHRSGTTLLAKMLAGLGVFIGRAGGSNREALHFKRVNKWIFAQLGATANHPEDVTPWALERLRPHLEPVMRRQMRGRGAARYLGPIAALRTRDLSRIDFPWAWKDPRNSFTVGLWKQLFPDAKIVHIYRHPVDVAASLKRREEKRLASFRPSRNAKRAEARLRRKPLYCHYVQLLDMREGVRLWQRYVEACMDVSLTFPRDTKHFRYETLLESPEESIGELAEFLGLRADASHVARLVTQMNPDRRFAHRSDPSMLSLADEISDLQLVQKLDYHTDATRSGHAPSGVGPDDRWASTGVS